MKIISILLFTVFLLPGCVDTPVQSTTVVDDRPRITFDIKHQAKSGNYSVIIDGIDYGSLSKYLSDKNALRVISGKHKIEVLLGNTLIKTYNVVLGANETRVLKVPTNE